MMRQRLFSFQLWPTWLWLQCHCMICNLNLLCTKSFGISKNPLVESWNIQWVWTWCLQAICSGKGSNLVEVRTAEEEAWICLQSLIRRKTSLLVFFYYQNNSIVSTAWSVFIASCIYNRDGVLITLNFGKKDQFS